MANGVNGTENHAQHKRKDENAEWCVANGLYAFRKCDNCGWEDRKQCQYRYRDKEAALKHCRANYQESPLIGTSANVADSLPKKESESKSLKGMGNFLSTLAIRIFAILGGSAILMFPVSVVVMILVFFAAFLCVIPDVMFGSELGDWIMNTNWSDARIFAFSLCLGLGGGIFLHPEAFDKGRYMEEGMKNVCYIFEVIFISAGIIIALLNANLLLALIFGPIAILLGWAYRMK